MTINGEEVVIFRVRLNVNIAYELSDALHRFTVVKI